MPSLLCIPLLVDDYISYVVLIRTSRTSTAPFVNDRFVVVLRLAMLLRERTSSNPCQWNVLLSCRN